MDRFSRVTTPSGSFYNLNGSFLLLYECSPPGVRPTPPIIVIDFDWTHP